MAENSTVITEELFDVLATQVAIAYRIPVKFLYPIGHPKGFSVTEEELERLSKVISRRQTRFIEVYIFGDHAVRSRPIEAEGALKVLLESLLPGEFFGAPLSWWPEGADLLHDMPDLGRKPVEKNPYSGFWYYRLNEDGSIPDTSWVEKPISEVAPDFARSIMRGANTPMGECNRREEKSLG
jgi:hypothetical protein